MTGLVGCSRCNKKMIDEEYAIHNCIPEIKSHKTLKFTHYYITKEPNGTTKINITTKDGIWLECFEIPEEKEHTKIPYQPTGNTENYSPNRQQHHFLGAVRFMGHNYSCFVSGHDFGHN